LCQIEPIPTDLPEEERALRVAVWLYQMHPLK